MISHKGRSLLWARTFMTLQWECKIGHEPVTWRPRHAPKTHATKKENNDSFGAIVFQPLTKFFFFSSMLITNRDQYKQLAIALFHDRDKDT